MERAVLIPENLPNYLPIQGVTKDGFVAFQVSSNGASLFLYDPEFAQSASKK